MNDGVAGLLHVHDVVSANGPMIRLLAAAFRIKIRLIEDDALPLDREHLREELLLLHVLVHAELRRRRHAAPRVRLRGFGGDNRVAARDAREEVVWDFDGHLCEFLDDLWREAVGVVQLQ